jgi:release factor glutamine methyltransferase
VTLQGTARAAPDQAGPTLRAAAARLAAAGLATARQDAELLLARALGTSRLALQVEPARPVPPAARRAFEALLDRRLGHEPLQYLLGAAELGGLTLAVGPGVFIPRPETEILVRCAVADAAPRRAVDLCTGSGAVACALARRRPALRVWGVEREAAALAWAQTNVRRLGLAGQVTLLEGDLWAALAGLPRAWDLVVANPPYLARATLEALPAEVRAFEPTAALDGGADGLEVVVRIVAGAPEHLRPGGRLLVEIGADQGPAVRGLVAADGRYASAVVHADHTGADRVVEARRA